MKVYVVVRKVYNNEVFVEETGSLNSGFVLENARVNKTFGSLEKAQEYIKEKKQYIKDLGYNIIWDVDNRVSGVLNVRDYQRKISYLISVQEVF